MTPTSKIDVKWVDVEVPRFTVMTMLAGPVEADGLLTQYNERAIKNKKHYMVLKMPINIL